MAKLLLFAATIIAATLVLTVEALDRKSLLRVVGTVRGNYLADPKYDDVAENEAERRCYGKLTDDANPVCGSDGKKYQNMSAFEQRQCLTKVIEELDLAVMDMGFCKEAALEDAEHVRE